MQKRDLWRLGSFDKCKFWPTNYYLWVVLNYWFFNPHSYAQAQYQVHLFLTLKNRRLLHILWTVFLIPLIWVLRPYIPVINVFQFFKFFLLHYYIFLYSIITINHFIKIKIILQVLLNGGLLNISYDVNFIYLLNIFIEYILWSKFHRPIVTLVNSYCLSWCLCRIIWLKWLYQVFDILCVELIHFEEYKMTIPVFDGHCKDN